MRLRTPLARTTLHPPCRLILGAEERGNRFSDGLPPSGVNEARSL